MYLLRSAAQDSADADKPIGPFMRFQRRFERGFEKFAPSTADVWSGGGTAPCFRDRVLGAWCLGTAMLVPFLGQDFFPTSDTGEIRLHFARQDRNAHRGGRADHGQRETRIRSLIPKAELGSILDNIVYRSAASTYL